MAKDQKSAPVEIDFTDVDKVSVERARAALQSGRSTPLTPPKSAKVSTDKHNVQYSRWSEQITIVQAYRTTTATKLQDIVIIGKVRQSDTKKNNDLKVFSHHYKNPANPVPENHVFMNDQTMGAIVSLLQATGFMQGDTLKGSLLNRMFPTKGKPGADSPLNGKAVMANLVQKLEPRRDRKTNKPVLDDDGEQILDPRDSFESFLPSVAPEAPEEDEDDEDAEDDVEEGGDESDDEDTDGEDADEDGDDADEDEEEEEEAPAPPVRKTSKPAPAPAPAKKPKGK